uniref:DUF5858 domain-containing protein n=1 Tax=Marseillevirus sp. TaxID=2809551 RepID=A0AA96EP42_9VIRU|nr:hypothetical protein MarFTMF_122 [Marseillevirus sp.]
MADQDTTHASPFEIDGLDMVTSRRSTVSQQLSEEVYARAEKKANDIISKIQNKLPVPYPIYSHRVFSGICVRTPNAKSFQTDGEKIYVWDDLRLEIPVEEEELVETMTENILRSGEYQPYLTNKFLRDLNENFVSFFSWLRESVELVPDSERVQKIQEEFENRQ